MLGWRRNREIGSSDAAGLPQAEPAEQSELALLHRVNGGDRAAFEALYRLYHPRLYRFLQRLTRRPELSEEVLDDTMLVVWQRGNGFNGHSKLSTWIFGIAYRKALNMLRRQDLPLDDQGAAEALVDPDADPAQRLGLSQLQRRLGRALAGLSAEHRLVVELCYFHGFGYREIAQIVDCPAETVKTRMFYARRRLRLLLADLEPGQPGELDG
jgi:RNA polymerase sigma-70 factor (ECF subfamily)